MQKLIRFLVIYTAATTTILLLVVFFETKGALQLNQQTASQIDSLRQGLSKVTTNEQSVNNLIQSEKELAQKLDSLTSKQVLGTSSAQASTAAQTTNGGFVTINDQKWLTADVYESQSYSAKVVGTLEFNKAYRFLQKDGSWYQVVLPESQLNGWVAARFLKEIE